MLATMAVAMLHHSEKVSLILSVGSLSYSISSIDCVLAVLLTHTLTTQSQSIRSQWQFKCSCYSFRCQCSIYLQVSSKKSCILFCFVIKLQFLKVGCWVLPYFIGYLKENSISLCVLRLTMQYLRINGQNKALLLKFKFVFLLKMVVEIQCFKCMRFYLAPQDIVFPDPTNFFNNSVQRQAFHMKICDKIVRCKLKQSTKFHSLILKMHCAT